jgi:hypothetical protein
MGFNGNCQNKAIHEKAVLAKNIFKGIGKKSKHVFNFVIQSTFNC